MAGHLERTHSSSADELRRKTERERTDGRMEEEEEEWEGRGGSSLSGVFRKLSS